MKGSITRLLSLPLQPANPAPRLSVLLPSLALCARVCHPPNPVSSVLFSFRPPPFLIFFFYPSSVSTLLTSSCPFPPVYPAIFHHPSLCSFHLFCLPSLPSGQPYPSLSRPVLPFNCHACHASCFHLSFFPIPSPLLVRTPATLGWRLKVSFYHYEGDTREP